MITPQASIVIATRNRREDTLRAVASAFAQTCAVEVLVYDDDSDDGTATAVREIFSQARVFESTGRTGYIVNRNRGFRDAHAPLIFSLDDDAYFSTPDIVARTVAMFDSEANVAAIAIPYIEPVNRLSLSSQRTPFTAQPGDELRSYVGCSHAVRRDAALAVGGYREFFVHQHEERDFCIRLYAAGYRVIYGDSAPIVHMVSPKRESNRITWYGGRNQIFCEALNAPFPEVLVRVPRTIAGMLTYRFSWSRLPLKLGSIASGLAESLWRARQRTPISRAVYARYRALPGHGPMAWSGDIPPPCHEIEHT